jgi:hypothetical protein
MISIDKLAGGGASERIQREINKIAENVLDPNTKADATRTLTISLTIKPNKQRQVGEAELVVKSSLAPAAGLPTSFVFDFDSEGNAVMEELKTGRDPNQTAISDSGEVVDGVGNAVQEKKVINGHFR